MAMKEAPYPNNWFSPAVAGFIAAIVTAILYLPSLGNGFVNWDDQACVYDNPNIASIDLLFIKYAATAVVNSNWHPLTVFSYAVDYAVWGLNPLGYHLTNVIFHSAATFLVAPVAARLLDMRRFDASKGALAGLFAALLFGLHPLHVESVAWVAERKDVLSGFFFLLSVLFYLRYISSSGKAPYLVSLSAFVLALLSKPMAVTLPVVLLILDLYIGRLKDIKRCIIEKIPFFALSALAGLATIRAQSLAGAVAPLDMYPITVRVFVSVKAYAFYVYKTFLPFGLAPFYPRELTADFLSAGFIASLVLLASITVFSIAARRNRAYLSAWLYYIITLLPVIGIVQVGSQAAADRYMYLPSLSIFILVSAALVRLFEKPGKGAVYAPVALAVILSGVLGLLTVRQTAVWKDSVALWSHEVKLYPKEAPIGYNNLGLAYKALGDLDKAVFYYNKAIEIDPFHSDAIANRGVAFMGAGDMRQAIDDLSAAVRINPMNLEAISNLGAAYFNSGDYGSAVKVITKAIEMSPGNSFLSRNYFNRGLAYKALGEYGSALSDFSAIIGFEPMFQQAYLNRGLVYIKTNELDRAVEDLSFALNISPNSPAAYYYLGMAYHQKGDRPAAITYLSRASSMGLRQADEYLKAQGLKPAGSPP